MEKDNNTPWNQSLQLPPEFQDLHIKMGEFQERISKVYQQALCGFILAEVISVFMDDYIIERFPKGARIAVKGMCEEYKKKFPLPPSL
jgi:hypothetical protein